MKTYRISNAVWGTSVVTVTADNPDAARALGEEIFRSALRQQQTFVQNLSGDYEDYEIEHSIDTEFEVEVGLLYNEDDPRVEPMARAYMQDIYGTEDVDELHREQARRIARKMLGAADA